MIKSDSLRYNAEGEPILTLPTIDTVPAGYYVSFTNKGATKMIVQPEKGEEIDGESSIELHSQESLEISSAKVGKHKTQWITLCQPKKK